MQLASGIIALTVLLLVEKSRLHALVRLLDDRGFRAGARFAVLALVVLPLLPEGPYGPMGGIRPRALWALVLFFSGLSFLRLHRAHDRRRPLRLRGGGPARWARVVDQRHVDVCPPEPGARHRQARGWPAGPWRPARCSSCEWRWPSRSSTRRCCRDLVPLLVAPLAVGVVAVWLSVRRRTVRRARTPEAPSNPLQLGAALQMAAAFQVVLFLLEGVNRWFGNAGLLASAFALGLTDVDALTASMTSRVAGGLAADVGAVAIAAGILSNSLTKLGIALAIGRGRFRLLTAHRPGGDDAGGTGRGHRPHLRRISQA